jgi:hypothetical protein
MMEKQIEAALARRLQTMSLIDRVQVLLWLWSEQPPAAEVAQWLGLESLPPKKPVTAENGRREGIRLVRR